MASFLCEVPTSNLGRKYGRKAGIELGLVDPLEYFEAFGATGFMTRTPDEVAPVLEAMDG